MRDCVIVAYGRSAIAKANKGSLANVNPVDFGAEVLKGVLEKLKNKLEYKDIEDVIVGCAIPEGKMGLNAGRNIVLRSGLPDIIPGFTLNRFCASSLQAVAIASAMIKSGMQEIVVAGGVESMTEPVLSEHPKFLNEYLVDNTEAYIPMGLTAENVAKKYKITREVMDEFAANSHMKASKAINDKLFEKEIIPVKGINKSDQSFIFKKDECVRENTSKDILNTLQPCFKKDGLLTAGTSSQRSDGASFLVLMSREKALQLGIKPIAKFLGFSVSGLDPAYMGMGPVKATKKVLDLTDLEINDLDVIELNEAFASQSIACINELGFSKDKVNPRGGAIAMGHPLGATGGILLSKAISYLEDTNKKTGLITMCIGGGMGAAAIIEMEGV